MCTQDKKYPQTQNLHCPQCADIGKKKHSSRGIKINQDVTGLVEVHEVLLLEAVYP
jgi:hypothetical protein